MWQRGWGKLVIRLYQFLKVEVSRCLGVGTWAMVLDRPLGIEFLPDERGNLRIIRDRSLGDTGMTDERNEFVWVVVGDEDEPSEQPVVRGKGGMFDDTAAKVAGKLAAARRISVVELEQKMSQFLGVVGRLFRQAEQQANLTAAQSAGKTSHLKLDEVEMSIEITAGGEVKLIAGGKAETKGSIKLKFKRVDG